MKPISTVLIAAGIAAITACSPAIRKQPMAEPIMATARYSVTVSVCDKEMKSCRQVKKIANSSSLAADGESLKSAGSRQISKASEELRKFAKSGSCPGEGDVVVVESGMELSSTDPRFKAKFPSSEVREGGYSIKAPDPASPRTVSRKEFCGQ